MFIYFEYCRLYIIEKEKKKINGEEEKKFFYVIIKCDYLVEDFKYSCVWIIFWVNKIFVDLCWLFVD